MDMADSQREMSDDGYSGESGYESDSHDEDIGGDASRSDGEIDTSITAPSTSGRRDVSLVATA